MCADSRVYVCVCVLYVHVCALWQYTYIYIYIYKHIYIYMYIRIRNCMLHNAKYCFMILCILSDDTACSITADTWKSWSLLGSMGSARICIWTSHTETLVWSLVTCIRGLNATTMSDLKISTRSYVIGLTLFLPGFVLLLNCMWAVCLVAEPITMC